MFIMREVQTPIDVHVAVAIGQPPVPPKRAEMERFAQLVPVLSGVVKLQSYGPHEHNIAISNKLHACIYCNDQS